MWVESNHHHGGDLLLGSCGLTTPGDARQKKRYQLLQSGKTKTTNILHCAEAINGL
jgi:hypothetical protein